MSRPNIMDRIMADPINMPGFADLVVTRGFAYQWLRDCGWNPCERGYGSLEYMVFIRKPVDLPLEDEDSRDLILNRVRNDFLR